MGADETEHTWLLADFCPECGKLVVWVGTLSRHHAAKIGSSRFDIDAIPEEADIRAIFPKTVDSEPVPKEVPQDFSEDYREARLILADSPKASAALSRRCLQHILREKSGVKHGTLYSEIQEVINNNSLPSHIVEVLDVPRKMGNVAAHPMKEQDTGAIVNIEPWEAAWCLEVIEALYDYYFVMPSRNAERLQRLTQKGI